MVVGVQESIIVANNIKDFHYLGLDIIPDFCPGKGPLAGIHSGLIASSYEVNIIVACDMPFVTAELATVIVNNIGDYDAVVPVINGKKHPLFSAYKKKVINIVEESFNKDRHKMKHLLDGLNVLYLSEQDLNVVGSLERNFINMNDPNDYKTVKM